MKLVWERRTDSTLTKLTEKYGPHSRGLSCRPCFPFQIVLLNHPTRKSNITLSVRYHPYFRQSFNNKIFPYNIRYRKFKNDKKKNHVRGINKPVEIAVALNNPRSGKLLANKSRRNISLLLASAYCLLTSLERDRFLLVCCMFTGRLEIAHV